MGEQVREKRTLEKGAMSSARATQGSKRPRGADKMVPFGSATPWKGKYVGVGGLSLDASAMREAQSILGRPKNWARKFKTGEDSRVADFLRAVAKEERLINASFDDDGRDAFSEAVAAFTCAMLQGARCSAIKRIEETSSESSKDARRTASKVTMEALDVDNAVRALTRQENELALAGKRRVLSAVNVHPCLLERT